MDYNSGKKNYQNRVSLGCCEKWKEAAKDFL